LSGALYTLASDVFGKNDVATATGLTGMAGYAGATLFSLAVGVVVALVGYDPLFVSLACFDLIGAVVVWFVLKEPREPQQRAADTIPPVADAARA
jgi:ACS family hexuronate transporter-like MFS transporter